MPPWHVSASAGMVEGSRLILLVIPEETPGSVSILH